MARKRSGLRKSIRKAYRILGVLNTLSHLMSGDPGKVAKHLTRRRIAKLGGRLIK